MKILNIGHNDLDQLGCELVLKHVYGEENVVVERCHYGNVNGTLYRYLKEGLKGIDKVYITDISISEKMASWVESSFSDKIVLIDHHQTATWLNQYDWARIQVKDMSDSPISASKLVYEYFKVNHPFVKNIVELCDSYDTWKWSIDNDAMAKNLNDIMYEVGYDELLSDMLFQLKYGNDLFKFNSEYEFLLKIKERKYKEYLEKTISSVTELKYKDYDFGMVFAEAFISELGNDLAKKLPHLDFVMIVNMRSSISLRGNKGVDLSVIAKELGEIIGSTGGGHKDASGIGFTKEMKCESILNAFKGKIVY